MNVRSHHKTGASRGRKNRRRANDALKRRYENAWDANGEHELNPSGRAGLSRTAKIVMLAPMFGALGAYIYFRRRK